MKAILAIDPGTRGGLAWIDTAERVTLKTADALLLLEYARRFERGSVPP
jgi:hypothetical protein